MSLLPVELLYDVVETAWSSTLTPAERVEFMKTSRLISKTWSAIYDTVFSVDVHIPSKSFYYRLFNDISRDFSRCRCITFTVCGGLLPDGTDPLPPRSLEFIHHFDMKKLTSLDTLSIVYYNAAFPDPCAQGFFIAMPDFLSELKISYTFSPDIPTSLVQDLRRNFSRSYKVRYVEPEVGTLEINGADEYIAAIWESIFPRRQKLIRDGKEEKQPLIPVQTPFEWNYALPYVLRDLLRAREFNRLQRANDSEALRSACASVVTAEDEPVFPAAPDVSRSPTERSVKITSPVSERRQALPQDESLLVRENKINGVRLLSYSPIDPSSLLPMPLGEVGYIDKSAGAFSSLFNAFEPHVTGDLVIPSLHGYGVVQIQTVVIPAQGTSAAQEAGYKDGGISKAKKAVGAIFKAASGKVGGAKLKSKAKNLDFKCLEKDVAESWFKENVDRIVRLYGKSLGVSRDNLVLVTGSPS
jgi:hypothetical protein